MCKKITYEKVKEFIINTGHYLLTEESDYINASTPINIKCKNCDKNFKRKFAQFKLSTNCPYCLKNAKIPFSVVLKFVTNKGYKLLTTEKNYKNSTTPLDLECKDCKNIFHPTFKDLKNSKGNGKCAGHTKKFTIEFVKNYIELTNEYKLLSIEYKSANEKLNILCLKCNNQFEKTFEIFKNRNSGCICQKESNGEKRIKSFLNKFNIEFKRQYKMKDCKNIRVLPFDFYLPNYNIIIEFDGIQHFKKINFFEKKFNMEKLNTNDLIKTNYCYNNGIFMLRIDYTYIKKIDNILKKIIFENYLIRNDTNLILVTDINKYQYLNKDNNICVQFN